MHATSAFAVGVTPRVRGGWWRRTKKAAESRNVSVASSVCRRVPQHASKPVGMSPAAPPVRLVIGYAREDERYVHALVERLRPFAAAGLLELWFDRHVAAGADWNDTILGQFRRADIVLFMVSDDLFTSEYATRTEIPTALARHERGSAVVVPVPVRASRYWPVSSLHFLQTATQDGLPLADAPDPEAAWTSVVNHLVGLASDLRARRTAGSAVRRAGAALGLAAAAGLLTHAALQFATRTLPKELTAELVPAADDLLRTMDDFSWAALYLTDPPASAHELELQRADVVALRQAFAVACAHVQLIGPRFKTLREELREVSPQLANSLEALHGAAIRCSVPTLPPPGVGTLYEQFDSLRVHTGAFATGIQGELQTLREARGALEQSLVDWVVGEHLQCED